MTNRQFFTSLSITTLVVAACLALEAFLLDGLRDNTGFLVLCLGVFVALTLAIYFSALIAAKSENPARLAQYVLVLTFTKMAVSLALVYGYYLAARPQGQTFLLPFFTAYLGYTIFETWFLLKLNKWAAARQKLQGKP